MAIVQKVSGQGLHEYLRPRLFDRIGIDEGRLKWICLPDGSQIGAGGLYAAAEDSLRLMKLYLDGGVWEGERILAEDYVKQATTKQIDNRGHGYGFQIHMGSRKGSYYGSGALGQTAIAVPDLDMIIVFYQTGKYLNPAGTDFKDSFRSSEYYFESHGHIFKTLLPAVKKDREIRNTAISRRWPGK
jgi:CubicO group peptidase (beta-lactamase class C family)